MQSIPRSGHFARGGSDRSPPSPADRNVRFQETGAGLARLVRRQLLAKTGYPCTATAKILRMLCRTPSPPRRSPNLNPPHAFQSPAVRCAWVMRQPVPSLWRTRVARPAPLAGWPWAFPVQWRLYATEAAEPDGATRAWLAAASSGSCRIFQLARIWAAKAACPTMVDWLL